MTEVSDYNRKPLREGAHVEGWHDGVPYTATVKEIRPPEPGSGYRHIILVRDEDQAEVESFSDAVAVITEEGRVTREASTMTTTLFGLLDKIQSASWHAGVRFQWPCWLLDRAWSRQATRP